MAACSAQEPVHADLTLGSAVWLLAFHVTSSFYKNPCLLNNQELTLPHLPFCVPQSF